jgi:hypothetical protein
LKITFVSLTEDVFIPSLRYLSAYLKAQGHTTTLILLPWNYTDKTLNAANRSYIHIPTPFWSRSPSNAKRPIWSASL